MGYWLMDEVKNSRRRMIKKVKFDNEGDQLRVDRFTMVVSFGRKQSDEIFLALL